MGDCLFAEVLILQGLRVGWLGSVVDIGVMGVDLEGIRTKLRMRIDSIGVKKRVLVVLRKC
jgi:hypothetical protein